MVMMNILDDGAGIERMNMNAGDSLHTKLLIGIGLSILAPAAY
jgi:hypothetical protein